MRPLLILALALAACSRVKPEPVQDPSSAMASLRAEYVARLTGKHLDHGQVVGHDAGGGEIDQGDSQVMNGAARYALGCDEGDRVDQAVLAMMGKEGGALVRFEPLPEQYVGSHNQATFDTAVGVYLDIAVSLGRCHQEARWHDVFAGHLAYLAAHGRQLYDGTGATTVGGFDLVPDLIAQRLGLAGAPPDGELQALEAEAVVWATGDLEAKAACYRMNLIDETFRAMEALGVPPGQTTLNAICAVTRSTGLPVWDHRCGVRPLGEWLSVDWREGQWAYRHQRCGAWEKPDGDGNDEPFVDWLYGYQVQYGGGA